VKQGPSLPVDRDQVRAAGELVVLVRLVEERLVAVCTEKRRLGVAHRCVDGVCIPCRVAATRRRQPERGVDTEGCRHPSVRVDRAAAASLETLHGRLGKAGTASELTDRPSTAQPGIDDLPSKLHRQSRRELIGSRGGATDLAW
jgi:hypothetical protein